MVVVEEVDSPSTLSVAAAKPEHDAVVEAVILHVSMTVTQASTPLITLDKAIDIDQVDGPSIRVQGFVKGQSVSETTQLTATVVATAFAATMLPAILDIVTDSGTSATWAANSGIIVVWAETATVRAAAARM